MQKKNLKNNKKNEYIKRKAKIVVILYLNLFTKTVNKFKLQFPSLSLSFQMENRLYSYTELNKKVDLVIKLYLGLLS